MKKLSSTIFVIILLFSINANASQWDCLRDWVSENQNYLSAHHVSFWHADRWLTEAYAFDATSDDPFATEDSQELHWKFTDLGNAINGIIEHCPCTNSWDVVGWLTHVEGLCWKASSTKNSDGSFLKSPF